jgi:excisionase family DNA binding protein
VSDGGPLFHVEIPPDLGFESTTINSSPHPGNVGLNRRCSRPQKCTRRAFEYLQKQVGHEEVPVGKPELLPVPEAAEYLGVRERWLRRAIFEGRIGTVKLGRMVRIRRSELDRLVQEGERPATRSL